MLVTVVVVDVVVHVDVAVVVVAVVLLFFFFLFFFLGEWKLHNVFLVFESVDVCVPRGWQNPCNADIVNSAAVVAETVAVVLIVLLV